MMPPYDSRMNIVKKAEMSPFHVSLLSCVTCFLKLRTWSCLEKKNRPDKKPDRGDHISCPDHFAHPTVTVTRGTFIAGTRPALPTE